MFRRLFRRATRDQRRWRRLAARRYHRPQLDRLEDRNLPSTLLALTNDGHLLTFDTAAPGTVTHDVVVKGLAQGDALHALAVSPQGVLYGIAGSVPSFEVSFDRLYTLNPGTGVATPGASLSGDGLFSVGGTLGASFDPLTGRLRALDDTGHNELIDPATGAVTTSGSTPAFVAGDPNQRFGCFFTAAAYTDEVPGATAATLYGIATVPALVTLGGPFGDPSPDTGQAHTVAATQSLDAFTIVGPDNAAYGAGKNIDSGGNASSLWTVDLNTGAASRVGDIGSTSAVVSLAGMPGANFVGPGITIADTTVVEHSSGVDAVFTVKLVDADGMPAPSTKQVTVDYATADGRAQAGRDYSAVSGTLTFQPGEVSQQITVPILSDTATGLPETFLVNLSSPVNLGLVRSQAVGEIHADGTDVLGGIYREDLLHPLTRLGPLSFLDHSQVFQNTFQGGNRNPFRQTTGVPSVVLAPGTLDQISFANLDPDVHVALASVRLATVRGTATVTFVGSNGRFEVDASGSAAVSAGEEHVLQGDVLNPLLELGPIQEIDVSASGQPFASTALEAVTILVVPNEPPVAMDQFATTTPGQPVSINALGGASEVGGVRLHLAGFTQPLLGTATSSPTDPNQIIYQPAPGAHGRDAFSYTLADDVGQTAMATIQVTVDTPPTATDDVVVKSFLIDNARPGDLVQGKVLFSDADGDPLTVSLVQGPQHNNDAYGQFVLNPDGTFRYYLSALHDTFTFQVSDGFGLSRVATEAINVDDPPIVLPISGTQLVDSQTHLPFSVFDYPFFYQDNLDSPGPNFWTFHTLVDFFPHYLDGPGIHTFGYYNPLWTQGNTSLVVIKPALRGEFILHDNTTLGGQVPLSFQYTPIFGDTTPGTDTVTLAATDGFQYSNSVEIQIKVFTPSEAQFYGNASLAEQGVHVPPPSAPYNVAEAPDLIDSQPVTLTSPPGSDIRAAADPVPPGAYPPGISSFEFPLGFFQFQVGGLTPPPPRPAAPTLTVAGAGTTIPVGAYYVKITYTSADGESLPSPIGVVTAQTYGEVLTIASPATVTGATGWRAYLTGAGGGPFVLQGGTNAIGTDLSLSSLTLSGLAPPADSGVPPAMAVTSAGGSNGQIPAGNYFVRLTYVTRLGETSASETNPQAQTLLAGQALTINSPAAVPGAIGWRAYVSTDTDLPFILQGRTNALGTNLTLVLLADVGPTPPRPTTGAATTVTLTLPTPRNGNSTEPESYYKYGPTPSDPTNHWYPFLFDGRTGAVLPGQYDPIEQRVIPDHTVVLHFIDGQRGDDDVYNSFDDGVDGGITDAGGPAFGLPSVVAGVQGPTAGVPGQSLAFMLTAQEPPPADTSAGFDYLVNWGDGTPAEIVHRTAGNGAGVVVRHVFGNTGTYQVSVSAVDGQGQSSIATSTTVTVTAIALEPDPLAPGQTALAVGGTTGKDTINLVPIDPYGNLDVVVNGQFQGVFLPTGHVFVFGNGGNDTIRLGSIPSYGQTAFRVRAPALLFGGGGNVVLDVRGSSADNVLVGGTGTGTLLGGSGRDLLLGSPQSHFLTGPGDALVIEGITPFDDDLDGLNALLSEWARGGTNDPTRIDHLLHGGGLNGPAVLSSAVPAAAPARNVLFASAMERVRPVPLGPRTTLPATATTPTFTWSPVPGADLFRLTVDDLTTRRQGVLSADLTGTSWTPDTLLSQGHRYRWTLRAYDGLGNGSVVSGALDFMIAPLAAPVLLSPGGALPVTSTLPTFDWGPVVGADHYEVQVDDLTTGQRDVLQNRNALPNPWTPGTPLVAGHLYRWRVRAVGVTGPGPWSIYLGFRAE